MSFSLAKYKRACADYAANWEAVEIALYDLCKRHPDHQDQGGINAKLWIIGRAYATGIERKISSQGFQGSSMTQLGKHFWRNRHRVDKALQILRGVNQPLTPEKLTKILDAHGRLVRIIQGALRKGQTPRSFVSKYLHFHNPAVPISITLPLVKFLGLRDLRNLARDRNLPEGIRMGARKVLFEKRG